MVDLLALAILHALLALAVLRLMGRPDLDDNGPQAAGPRGRKPGKRPATQSPAVPSLTVPRPDAAQDGTGE